MTFVRPPFAARTASLAMTGVALVGILSACSSQTPSTAVPTGGSSAPRTTSTVKPTASAKAPTSGTGAETPAQAAAEVAKVLAAQAAAAAKPGAEGKALRDAAYGDKALAAATAQGRLVSTLTAAQQADLALSPVDPVILAVSRTPAYPRVILAKATLAGSGSPVLVALTASSEGSGYRISSMTQLLPSARVGKFDPVLAGSPPVGDASGLAIAPDALIAAYAGALAYPAPPAATTPVVQQFTPDAFFAAVRKGATDQAAALSNGVSLKQVHTPVGVIAALRAAAGEGAYVVAVMERKDTLTERTANALTASKAFTILSGRSVVDKTAVLRTYEFVVFHIPVSGPATVVAAAEQLYAASGS